MLEVIHEHASKVFETHELVALQVNTLLDGMQDSEVRAREATLNRQLKALVAALPQLQDIWVLDRNGAPLVTGNIMPVSRDLDLSDRAYFRAHRDGLVGYDATYVSEVLKGRAQAVYFFQLAKRRTGMIGEGSDAPFNGVTAVSVEPSYFARTYGHLLRGTPFATATLVREDGMVLARYPEIDGDRLMARMSTGSGFLNAVRSRPTEGVYTTSSAFDGVERMIAYRHLPAHPVYVTVGMDVAAVTGAWHTDMLWQGLVGVPAMLALLIASIVALRLAEREQKALLNLKQEAERRASAEGQLRQAQKMEALGRLTGGIAHDFNNLLTVVIGNLDRHRRFQSDDKARRAVENAKAGASRAAALTQRLLAFSRQQTLQPERVDANALVLGMRDMLSRTLGETIRLKIVPGADLWPILADHNQLENALLNLCINARDAMPGGGTLTIATENRPAPEDRGDQVAINVTDAGTGMSEEVIARAFEPFFTTKADGHGTGLGLAQVHGFARQSGGDVEIRSREGQGTSVILTLPRLMGEAPTPGRVDDAETAALAVGTGHGETVIVVEDDELVRRFAAEALSDGGYRVLEAADGLAALAMLREHPETSVLFTDIVLAGGMNGSALATEARRRRPDLKVLFTSGYGRDALESAGWTESAGLLVPKPFVASELLDRVGALIQRRRAA